MRPNPGHAPWLWAVAAAYSSDDVWAVGTTGNQTLVMHWMEQLETRYIARTQPPTPATCRPWT